jgi:hypothetical protein
MLLLDGCYAALLLALIKLQHVSMAVVQSRCSLLLLSAVGTAARPQCDRCLSNAAQHTQQRCTLRAPRRLERTYARAAMLIHHKSTTISSSTPCKGS